MFQFESMEVNGGGGGELTKDTRVAFTLFTSPVLCWVVSACPGSLDV